MAVRIPKHAKKELEAYLDCGLLCRGFARLRCERCEESRLVAFSCKGRGFCPSCLGRRMGATAANLIEDVLPEVAHRPWVLTFPFPWRRRLAHCASVAAIGRSTNRAELLRRTFAIDVLECPTCKGRMKLVAMVTEPRNIVRFLCALGEPTDVPARSPNRGPPYWKSTVVRRKALGDAV
ncbi:transposase zinc-binding domain-containing protein [Sorangium sp. So ce341]